MKSMKTLIILALFSVSNLTFANGWENGPCAEDVKTLCAGAEKTGGVIKCLKENEAKLSASCKEKMASKGKKKDG